MDTPLLSAITQMQKILYDLPRKAYSVREALVNLKESLPLPNEERVQVWDPLYNELYDKINNILGKMNAEYEEGSEETIDSKSKIYPDFLDYFASLNSDHRAIMFTKDILGLEKILNRIDSVLPPIHFDFTTGVRNLEPYYVTNEVLNDIQKAIVKFTEKQYAEAISSCEDASKRITENFVNYLHHITGKSINTTNSWGSRLEQIQKILNASTVLLLKKLEL